MSVGPDGRLGVLFYDRRKDSNNLLIDAYYSESLDGGLTFLPNVRISEVQDEVAPGTLNSVLKQAGLKR